MELKEEIHSDKLKIIIDNFEELYPKIGSLKDPSRGFSSIEDKKTVLTILKRYYSTKVSSSSIQYKFAKSINWGRKFSIGPSLQSINKVLRHTLSKDIYDDLDIANCHPIILLKYCTDKNLKCDILKDYIGNRDRYIEDLIIKFNITKEDGKKIFLSILNGGIRSDKYNDEIIINFEKEIQDIITYFVKSPENNIFYMRAYKSKTNKRNAPIYNVGGSALNLYLCHEENIILDVIVNSLVDKGFTIGTYCFDGCLVYKNQNKQIKDFLELISEDVYNETGYKITLVVKPMDSDIDLSQYSSADRKSEVLLNETEVALYIFKDIRPYILYHPINRVLYIYNKNRHIWQPGDFDVLKAFVPNQTIRYCKDNNIILCDKNLNKISSSNWCNNIYKLLKPIIKRHEISFNDIITERCNDMFIIDKLLNQTVGLFPIAYNKVIDLKHKIIRDRAPTDYFTSTTECKYIENYDKDFIDKYIGSLLMTDNRKYIDYLISSVAYSMTNENNLKRFFIFNGKRDGGKSLFLNLIKEIFQDFGGSVNNKIFKKSKNESVHNSEIFSLINKRMAYVSELEEQDSFNEPLLKTITGKDEMNIRQCGSNINLQVHINSILFLATNELPSFKDQAFISRMRVIEFPNRFVHNADIRDQILSKKDDLFSYLVDKAYEFYQNNRNIDDVEEVLKYTEKMVDSKNSITTFFEDHIEITGNRKDRISKCMLFKYYTDYCNHFNLIKLGRNNFYDFITTTYKVAVRRDREISYVKYIDSPVNEDSGNETS